MKTAEQLLLDAQRAAQRAERTQHDLQSLTLFTRRQRPAREEAHRKALDRAAKNPVGEAARTVALESLFSEHERLRRADGVNPYDPRLEHLLDIWVPEAVAAASIVWGQDRDVAAFVTAEVFGPRLRATLEQYATVADDVAFESEVTDSTLIIEPTASGLRAKALFRDDGFGAIKSNPERVRFTSDDTRDGQRYTRLGIGTRIYTWFGYGYPDVCCRCSGPVSRAGAGVRRVMHAQAPSRWEGPSSWWEERSLDWETATPEAFARHPVRSSENPEGWRMSSRWPRIL